MRKRLLRRLAGSLAIELLLAIVALGADEYQAGFAAFGSAKALVLVDRHHHPALILNVAFATPLAVSDQIAAMAAKAHTLDRSALVIHATGAGEVAPQDAVTAIEAALSALQSARANYGSGRLTVSNAAGCTSVAADSVIRTCSEPAGEPVHGPIRSAFRVVDLSRGLQVRTDTPRYATVQAVALGESVVIVSAPANLLDPAPGRIAAALPAIEPDERVIAALTNVLARIARKR